MEIEGRNEGRRAVRSKWGTRVDMHFRLYNRFRQQIMTAYPLSTPIPPFLPEFIAPFWAGPTSFGPMGQKFLLG